MTTKTLISGNPPHFGAVYATDASAGAGDVGKVPLLNASGTLDSSFFTVGGALKVLKETVFAGMTTQSFTNGVDVTLDGLTYSVGIASGGSAAIVAGGLKFTAPTGSTSECALDVKTPQVGNLITADRWRRKCGVGVWCRINSFNWSTATTGFWYLDALFTAFPNWGIGARRTIGGGNSPVGAFYWRDGTDTYPSPLYNSGANNTTADVFLVYFRTPWVADIYYGTWAGSWPDMSAMTLGCTITNLSSSPSVSTALDGGNQALLKLHFGGGQTGGVTAATITYDRWRLTVWE